jgi:hypothetical protein
MARDGTKTGGRKAGTPNKIPKQVKDVFFDTFTKLQEDPKANLTQWAKENKTEFYKLSSKLLPIQLAGDPENPVAVNVVEGMTFEQLYQLKYGVRPGGT